VTRALRVASIRRRRRPGEARAPLAPGGSSKCCAQFFARISAVHSDDSSPLQARTPLCQLALRAEPRETRPNDTDSSPIGSLVMIGSFARWHITFSIQSVPTSVTTASHRVRTARGSPRLARRACSITTVWFSKRLPELIRNIGNRKCFFAKYDNFFVLELPEGDSS
jgi:hypothetical protein